MKMMKVLEVLANSDKSWEDAAQNAVSTASKSLRNIKSVYMKDFSAVVEGDRITEYRVNCKITFELEVSELG